MTPSTRRPERFAEPALRCHISAARHGEVSLISTGGFGDFQCQPRLVEDDAKVVENVPTQEDVKLSFAGQHFDREGAESAEF
jgi:hypothetical protein